MRAAFRTLGCKVNQVETEALLGFLKALVWPAFLVYEAFAQLLG